MVGLGGLRLELRLHWGWGFVSRQASALADADRIESFEKSSSTNAPTFYTVSRSAREAVPMAPTKSVKGKSSKGKAGGPSKKPSKSRPAGSAPSGISKRKAKSLSLAKPGGAQKSKSSSSNSNKPKKRVYTEKELDIPKLNGIIPAGVAKPKGQKKGKKFVDDPVSMMAIMSVVNAEKDKNVESKIMRARQLEEIREAKRKEAEAKAEEKKAKFVSATYPRRAKMVC